MRTVADQPACSIWLFLGADSESILDQKGKCLNTEHKITKNACFLYVNANTSYYDLHQFCCLFCVCVCIRKFSLCFSVSAHTCLVFSALRFHHYLPVANLWFWSQSVSAIITSNIIYPGTLYILLFVFALWLYSTLSWSATFTLQLKWGIAKI